MPHIPGHQEHMGQPDANGVYRDYYVPVGGPHPERGAGQSPGPNYPGYGVPDTQKYGQGYVGGGVTDFQGTALPERFHQTENAPLHDAFNWSWGDGRHDENLGPYLNQYVENVGGSMPLISNEAYSYSNTGEALGEINPFVNPFNWPVHGIEGLNDPGTANAQGATPGATPGAAGSTGPAGSTVGLFPTGQGSLHQPFNYDPMAEQSNAGGTAATIADGTNMKAGATVISGIVNAVQNPNPQDGIERMIGLLAQYPDDEAAREALLLNIGNLYTAMQTSNPFGYTAEKFDQEAVLDRASQENIARGGMTQNQALTQQSLDRQTQEMIARGGMTTQQAAWQRNLDEQYRQGQLSNEEAAIQANRYGSEAALFGQMDAAEKAASAQTTAAETAATAAKAVATTQGTVANYAATLQANTARYADDSEFFTSMASVAAQERMAATSDLSAQAISYFQNEAAKAVASTNGIAAVDVAQINAGGAERVAIQNGWSAQQVADIQKQMNVAVAEMTNHTETFVATTMADAQRYAADQQKAAQQSVASTQAEAAKVVATTQAGGQTGAATTAGEAAKAVAATQAGAQTTSATTQAGATTTSATTMGDAQKAVATTNKEAAKAVAVQAGLNESAVATIMATVQEDIATANNTTAAAVATINATAPAEAARLTGLSQEVIANIQATSSSAIAAQTGLNEAAVATIMANAQTTAATTAANPFGLSSQQFLDMQGSQARGGLSVEERLGEISAANEPERLAALLGALAPSVQGSLQGFGMTAPPTVPTISNLRNTTEERQQYIEGLFGSFGVSPSALVNLIQSVSPGSPFGASTFA